MNNWGNLKRKHLYLQQNYSQFQSNDVCISKDTDRYLWISLGDFFLCFLDDRNGEILFFFWGSRYGAKLKKKPFFMAWQLGRNDR